MYSYRRTTFVPVYDRARSFVVSFKDNASIRFETLRERPEHDPRDRSIRCNRALDHRGQKRRSCLTEREMMPWLYASKLHRNLGSQFVSVLSDRMVVIVVSLSSLTFSLLILCTPSRDRSRSPGRSRGPKSSGSAHHNGSGRHGDGVGHYGGI